MNKKVKKLWVDALKSGKFEQTTGRLIGTNPDSAEPCYCCLGVLCELYRRETGKGKWDGNYFEAGFLDASDGQLPARVAKWADLPSTNPYIGATTATSLNDNEGKSFVEIANRINRHL